MTLHFQKNRKLKIIQAIISFPSNAKKHCHLNEQLHTEALKKNPQYQNLVNAGSIIHRIFSATLLQEKGNKMKLCQQRNKTSFFCFILILINIYSKTSPKRTILAGIFQYILHRRMLLIVILLPPSPCTSVILFALKKKSYQKKHNNNLCFLSEISK